MGKLRTSASFYRRGIPNSQHGFGALAGNNFSMVSPIYLFTMPYNKNQNNNNNNNKNKLITNGQVLYLDAGNKTSYGGSGTNWKNLGNAGNVFNASLLTTGASLPSFQNSNTSSYFSFDGSTQYAELARPVQDSFSYCVFFNTTQIGGDNNSPAWYANDNPQIIGGDVNSTVNDYGISIGVGTLFFGIGEQGGLDVTIKTPSNNYNDGNWHYLVATRNIQTGVLQLYMDGILTTDGNSGNNILNSSPVIRIACEAWSLTNFFQGKIAVVQAYNRVLSSSEINHNYNILKTRYQ